MKKSRVIMLTILVVLLAVTVVVAINYTYNDKIEKSTDVSVIVYGNNKERWSNLERGIKMAASEENAEITFVTMSNESNYREQNELVRKEIENGAEAIIMATSGGERQRESLENLSTDIPIILVESGIGEETELLSVKGNDYLMGYELGDKLCRIESKRVKIAIVSDEEKRDSVTNRVRGFYDRVSKKCKNIVFWTREDLKISQQLAIQMNLTREAVDIVVAFDNSSVESAIDAVINLDKNVKIYGVANSEKAVYYLDSGEITALAYVDEYSIGYIGAKALLLEDASYIDNKISSIEFKVVGTDEVYLRENQKLLFPIVK